MIAFGLMWVTAFDLALHMLDIRAKYQVPRAEIQKNWPVKVGGLAFPQTRIAAIPEAPTPPKNFQVVRYPELLARIGVALETPHGYPRKPYIADAAHLLGRPRWNTISMLNTYRELILSGLPPKAIESIFAIDASTFQFRLRARVTGNFIGDLRALNVQEIPSTLANMLFLDSATLPPGWSAPEPVSVTPPAEAAVSVVLLNYDAVSVVVDSDRAGFLYFVNGFAPDWRATVNGAATYIFRANGNFKAIQVPAGRSKVDFTYRPRIVIWAIWLFFGSLLLTASMAAGCFLAQWIGGSDRTPFRGRSVMTEPNRYRQPSLD